MTADPSGIQPIDSIGHLPIDEPAGGYMKMMEYRNSARGHLIALENKGAMEC